MSGLMETLGVLLLAVGGGFAGWRSSKLTGRWWMVGYFVPVLFIFMVAFARRMPWLEFQAPVSWMMSGRLEFGVLAAALPCLFATLYPKLETRTLRVAVMVFGGLAVLQASAPFYAPGIFRGRLAAIKTQVTPDGVCMQSFPYTCGPAAAVTSLRRLGYPAEEGELAVLAHTTPMTGTEPDDLRLAILERFGGEGLACEYKYFEKISELSIEGEVLVRVKFSWMLDHWVAVLEVTDERVVVGDPYTGRREYTHADFLGKWRHSGLQLWRVE